MPAGSTQAQIQTIINGAVSGDTVSFSAGTYVITGTFTVGNGITLAGNNCTWDGSSAANIVKALNPTTLTNFTVKDLYTTNIKFSFYNASNPANINGVLVSNVRFDSGKAESGTPPEDTHYIGPIKATSVTVSGCRFRRTSAYPGKGVYGYLAVNLTVQNCIFGASDSSGADAATYGHFKTAINLNNSSTSGGFVSNTLITGNWVYRNIAMTSGTLEDHGFYMLGFNGLTVTNNTISGWTPSSTGGAMKIRQGINAKVDGNTLIRSGILLYVYDNNPVLYLQDVVITNNTITCYDDPVPADIYHGIGYWRSFAYGLHTPPYEYSIRIANNTLNRATISAAQADLDTTSWNATNPYNSNLPGGVYNNTLNFGGTLTLKAGVAQSGNTFMEEPAADAYVRNGTYANTNYGSATSMVIKADTTGYARKSYVTFDIDAATSVSSATMKLYCSYVNTSPTRTISVYAITPSAWSESTITWNNAPAPGAFVTSFTVTNTPGIWYNVNVSSYVAAQKSAGATKASFLLINNGPNDAGSDMQFSTKEAASNHPQLVMAP